MTSQSDARRFMDTLMAAEQSGDASDLSAMFAPEASIHSLGSTDAIVGADGVNAFWKTYLQLFQSVRTKFTTTTVCESVAVLEWVSAGVLSGGVAIEYRGVTLLSFEDGKVTSFRSYYDSAAFVPEFEKHLNRGKSSR